MTAPSTHAERVLCGILHDRPDLLQYAILKIQDEHFGFAAHRVIYQAIRRYYDITGKVIPADNFAKTLEDADYEASKIIAYKKEFEKLTKLSVSDDSFKWAIEELKAEQLKKQTGELLTTGYEILERGVDMGREHLAGPSAALEWVSSRAHAVQRLSEAHSAPEGNVLAETKDVLTDYIKRREDRENGVNPDVIHTGIAAIDDTTDGFARGELILYAGFAGTGKSQLATQTAWYAATHQGKNVCFATSETVRAQVIRRIIARHSYYLFPDAAINSADLRKGTLSPEGEKALVATLKDLRDNSGYGQLNIIQIPSDATLEYVEARLKDYGRKVKLDLGVIDYLALLKPEVRRGNEREEFNDILRSAKGMAQSFYDGEGIPLISPWQIRREAYDQAQRNGGYYAKTALSDTSEAEKSSDSIITLFREEQSDNANRQMNLQFIKVRDDDIPPMPKQLAIDLRYSFIGAHHNNQNLGHVSGQSMEDHLASLGLG